MDVTHSNQTGARTLEITTDVDLTPREVAEMFWSMDNNQQAEFFVHLYNAIQRDNAKGITWMRDEYATMQWYQLRRGIKELPQEEQLKAANMIRAVAAEFFKFTLGDTWDWERFPHHVNA